MEPDKGILLKHYKKMKKKFSVAYNLVIHFK